MPKKYTKQQLKARYDKEKKRYAAEVDAWLGSQVGGYRGAVTKARADKLMAMRPLKASSRLKTQLLLIDQQTKSTIKAFDAFKKEQEQAYYRWMRQDYQAQLVHGTIIGAGSAGAVALARSGAVGSGLLSAIAVAPFFSRPKTAQAKAKIRRHGEQMKREAILVEAKRLGVAK